MRMHDFQWLQDEYPCLIAFKNGIKFVDFSKYSCWMYILKETVAKNHFLFLFFPQAKKSHQSWLFH